MSEPSKAQVEVIRFADPLSWQSWCAEPVIRRLEEILGDAVRITYRMGGLFENLTDWLEAKGLTKQAVMDTIATASEAAGMPLHADYLWRCGVKTTYTYCLAYKAAELQDPQLAHRYFRHMMEAFMVEGRLASHDEYIQLGGEIGLSTSRLRRDIDIPLAKDRFAVDRRTMTDSGLGFDSLLIRGPSGKAVRFDGFDVKACEDIIREVASDLPKHRPSDLVEYAERRRGLLPLREVAEVFRIPPPNAVERLTVLSTAGFLESSTLEAGAFWRWKGGARDRLPLNVALATYIPKIVPGQTDLARVLSAAARARYTDVADRPRQPQPFPFGPEAAARVGYPKEELAEVPAAALESFTGVGYLFSGAGIQRKETVLDVGCGSGTDAILAAAHLGRRGEVYGIDHTPAMAAKARACVAGARMKNIRILDGDAASIPLPPGSVDVALSNGVLHMQQDKATVLREIFRVLRPGGRLRLADVVVGLDASATLGSDPEMWAGGLSGAPLETELPKAIETAGFRETRVVGEHDYYAAFVPSAVQRIARAVGAKTFVVQAVKPDAPRKRR